MWFDYVNKRSGISRYFLGDDFIIVAFKNGSSYKYTNRSAGKININLMKNFAEKNEGLMRFINDNVKFDYEKKY